MAAAQCLEADDIPLRQYGIYSKLSNMLSGSIKDLDKGLFIPIQTRFEPLMETGRTSSRGPNIQNRRRALKLPDPWGRVGDDGRELEIHIKPDDRNCFRARDGYALVACDFSGAESHTLAQVCVDKFGQSKMADALNSGKDLHTWVAATILGCSYEEAVARINAGDPEAKAARQTSKPANFGYPGGCGVNRFMSFANAQLPKHLHLDYHGAAELKKQWYSAWPEMNDYFAFISGCTDDRGWYYVNHVRTERVRGRASYTAACNSHFQGLASDGAKAALWEVTRRQWCEPASALYGTHVVNFVHDEIIIECPVHQVEAAARELQDVMCYEFNKFTPDVPVHATADAMFHWAKDGVPCFKDDAFVWTPEKALAKEAA